MKDGASGFPRILSGLLVILVLLGAKHVLMSSSVGRIVGEATYALLQQRLFPHDAEDDPPLTLIDISGIPAVAASGDQNVAQSVTPRDSLERLLRSVAEKGPAAIALDIDFSSPNGKYLTTNDASFFRSCSELSSSTGIPIYLGVERQLQQGPSYDPNLGKLAASVCLSHPCKRLPIWQRLGEGQAQVYSLSAVLGRKLLEARRHRPAGVEAYMVPDGSNGADATPKTLLTRLIDWSLTRESLLGSASGEQALTYLVNYGGLGALRQSLVGIDPVSLGKEAECLESQRSRIHGHAVLIGDVKLATDTFAIAGVSPRPIPGVLIHACGALTWTSGLLCEIKPAARLAADLLFAVLAIAIAKVGGWLFSRRLATPNEPNIEWAANIATCLLVWTLGPILVKHTHVMWTDFFLVGLTLILHRPAHRFLSISMQHLSSALVSAFTTASRAPMEPLVSAAIAILALCAIGAWIVESESEPDPNLGRLFAERGGRIAFLDAHSNGEHRFFDLPRKVVPKEGYEEWNVFLSAAAWAPLEGANGWRTYTELLGGRSYGKVAAANAALTLPQLASLISDALAKGPAVKTRSLLTDPARWDAMNNLALSYRDARQYTNAQVLLDFILSRRQEAIGFEDVKSAEYLNNLAIVCRDKGDYVAAEALLKRCLDIRTTSFGPANVEVANTLNNLGVVYRETGKYEAAAEVLARAVALQRRIEPNQPRTGDAMCNLGTIYAKVGRYEEARQLMLGALAISERRADGVNMSSALANWAVALKSSGDAINSSALLAQALELRRNALAGSHAEKASLLENLASICRAAGNADAAEDLRREALIVRITPDKPSSDLSQQATVAAMRD